MDVTSSRWVRPGGVAVALVSFGITRLFVAEAVRLDTAVSFLFAGLVPLLIGLGLTVYGVALAIGAFSREFVNTVTVWTLTGTLAMVLVLVVTSFESLLRGEGFRVLSVAPLLVANVLLGGAVGGTLFGVRSATNRRQQREIKRQANRALLLDRLLRHEVINAVNIILGHTALLSEADDTAEAATTIQQASERIADTIDAVGELIEERDAVAGIDLARMVEPEVESTRAEFPDATVAYDGPDEPVSVVADDRLQLVVGELLENAGEHGATRIEVAVEANGSEASVSVSDDGSGLPDTQRELLTSGEFPEYDDPSAGFGLQIVRLLVLQYGGDITVGEGIDGGTTVTVTLPRVATESELGRSVNVTMSNLYWASVAGLVAGVAMGGFFSLTTDLLPIIGALYGVENPTIGWITHLFHSVIFAIVFAAGLSHPAVGSYVNGPLEGGVAGVAWGAVLWFAGAGIIMPLWLRAVGVMAVFPNLPRLGLVSHLIWGSVLGVAYVALERRDIGYFED